MQELKNYIIQVGYGSLHILLLGITASGLLWGILQSKCKPYREWAVFNIVCSCFSLAFILWFTVIGRLPREQRSLYLFLLPSRDFREIFLNALLFYPLGLSLSPLIGKKTIIIGFVLSLCIESWQYFAGTGTAQSTDLLMNTLGCAIGALPVLLANRWYAKNKHSEGTR